MIVAACCIPFQGNASTERCASDWTTNPVQFESVIQYDDMQSKANPTVHVLVNGKSAKMMLDTGANVNVLWNASLLDESLGPDSHRLDAHVASADSKTLTVALADDRGSALRQEFYVVPDSVLAADGYSGIVSPQAVAHGSAVVIDFEKNCFFTSSPFDIRSDKDLDVHRGATIPNPYGVMGIPVELDGKKIPLVVDTGASVTTILASLVDAKPQGQKSARAIDLLGAEIVQGENMRFVDLGINGKVFGSHPVVPQLAIHDKGIVAFGFIGMDILKNHVIYHDGTNKVFILLTRERAAKHIVGERRGSADESTQ